MKQLPEKIRNYILSNDILKDKYHCRSEWNKMTIDFMQKYQSIFLENDPFIIDEFTSKKDYFLTPFYFTEKIKDLSIIRWPLYDSYPNSDNYLPSVGQGRLDENGIMIIGMTAGFWDPNLKSGDLWWDIQKPWKPSFYFNHNTSVLLRLGFYEVIDKCWFTNIGKISLSKEETNKSYNEIYEWSWDIMKKEIELLKPKIILSIGKNVYDFLNIKGYESIKINHPSYYAMRGKWDEGLEYYINYCKNIKNLFI